MLDQTSTPSAWFGESYVARIGYPVLFDASGSFGDIINYEWDFNGDGVYDESTNEPKIIHTYTEPFEGLVFLQVSSALGKSVASAIVVANYDGSVSQLGEEYCEFDETGLPILFDSGYPLHCLVNSTMWPLIVKPPVIKTCLEELELPQMNLQSCDIQKKVKVIVLQVENEDYYSACYSLSEIDLGLASCAEMCGLLGEEEAIP